MIAVGAAVSAGIVNGGLGGAAWEIREVDGTGIPSVDGRPIPHAEDLSGRIRPGARLRVPPGLRLVIRSAGALAIEIAPGTDVTIPRRPGRWWGRRVRCELESGVIRVATEPGFQGATLAVLSPAARVELHAGRASVAAEPRGTRVGVLEGTARATPVGAGPITVTRETEVFVSTVAIEPVSTALGAEDRKALARLGGEGR